MFIPSLYFFHFGRTTKAQHHDNEHHSIEQITTPHSKNHTVNMAEKKENLMPEIEVSNTNRKEATTLTIRGPNSEHFYDIVLLALNEDSCSILIQDINIIKKDETTEYDFILRPGNTDNVKNLQLDNDYLDTLKEYVTFACENYFLNQMKKNILHPNGRNFWRRCSLGCMENNHSLEDSFVRNLNSDRRKLWRTSSMGCMGNNHSLEDLFVRNLNSNRRKLWRRSSMGCMGNNYSSEDPYMDNLNPDRRKFRRRYSLECMKNNDSLEHPCLEIYNENRDYVKVDIGNKIPASMIENNESLPGAYEVSGRPFGERPRWEIYRSEASPPQTDPKPEDEEMLPIIAFKVEDNTYTSDKHQHSSRRQSLVMAVKAELFLESKSKVLRRRCHVFYIIIVILLVSVICTLITQTRKNTINVSSYPSDSPTILVSGQNITAVKLCSKCDEIKACAGSDSFCKNLHGIQGNGYFYCYGGIDHGEKCRIKDWRKPSTINATMLNPSPSLKPCSACPGKQACAGSGGFCKEPRGSQGHGYFYCHGGAYHSEKCEGADQNIPQKTLLPTNSPTTTSLKPCSKCLGKQACAGSGGFCKEPKGSRGRGRFYCHGGADHGETCIGS